MKHAVLNELKILKQSLDELKPIIEYEKTISGRVDRWASRNYKAATALIFIGVIGLSIYLAITETKWPGFVLLFSFVGWAIHTSNKKKCH
ncbi:hypothetical protein A3715_11450 [Oleiphilus sp. HI0009]|nr:hypothetical protein A3715_11450 [Oleiphilus sp. HI0009]